MAAIVRTPRRRAARATFALAVAAGCYNVGVVPPSGVSRVMVPPFKNETFPFERDLELDLTRAVRLRLEEQTACTLVSSEGDADAVLEGTVRSYREAVAAEDTLDRPIRSIAVAEVSVRLRRAGAGGEVLFSDTWQERVAFVAGSAREGVREEMVRRIADRTIAQAVTSWE